MNSISHDAAFFKAVKDKSIKTDRFFLGDWKDKTSHEEKQKTFYSMLSYFIDNNIQMPVSKVFALADFSSAIEFSMQKNRTPSGKVILSNE